jgi:hypothetical protein
VEPKRTASRIETLDPNLDCPKIEKLLPKRANILRAMEEPKLEKLRIDSDDPR